MMIVFNIHFFSEVRSPKLFNTTLHIECVCVLSNTEKCGFIQLISFFQIMTNVRGGVRFHFYNTVS